MKKTITILGALLGVQLLLAAVLHFASRDFGGAQPGQPLLTVEPARVDRIVIEQPRQTPLTLIKEEGAWRLPDLHGFPASGDKVSGLIDKLAHLTPRMPVATTADAAERFKTADKSYERKVQLMAGEEQLAALYLGNSAGARRTYARSESDSAVYEIGFGAWEAGTKPDEWIDRGYLRLNEADITRVEMGDILLERKEGRWELAGLAEGEETNQQEAGSLVRRIANLGLASVLGKEEKPEYGQASPLLTATVGLKSGDSRRYTLSKQEGQEDYVLKSSHGDYFLGVSTYNIDPWREMTREKLIKKAETKETSASEPIS